MSFTQSAFIRKNTPELRSNLERLGISILMDKGDDTGGILVQYGVATNIWSKVAFKDLSSNGVIDCGENENLFLALAALRDDSDYMQFFRITDLTTGVLSDPCVRLAYGKKACKGRLQLYKYHDYLIEKLTTKELIEHFKEK